jgi:hypothetical protein
MTDAAIADAAVDREPASYLAAGHTLLSWLTTTDHKRIAILYAVSITLFFFIGGIAIGLVRLELMAPHGLFSLPTPTTACSRCMASSWCGFSWFRRSRRPWEISCCLS